MNIKPYSRNHRREVKKVSVADAKFGGPRVIQHRREEVAKVRSQVMAGNYNHPNVAVITSSDLQRMRKEAVLITNDELAQMRQIAGEQREKQQTLAKAKKERMIKMEQEKRKRAPVMDEFQQEELDQNNQLKNKARLALEENYDEVKAMNQMVNYAKTAAIRDAQLDEKDFIYKQKVEEQKRLDLMMEIERIKRVKIAEQKDRNRKTKAVAGKKVIIEQMKDREIKRLKFKEEQAKEAMAMVRHSKQLAAEERKKGVQKKQYQKEILDQILEANDQAIEKKKVYEQQEIEEDKRIMEYAVQKAQKEAEYAAEQKRIKDEKEREVGRLREMQERAQDKQEMIDALRAKRATEKAERSQRIKDKKEAEKRVRMNCELSEARRLQALEKQSYLQYQAQHERDEFQRVLDAQKISRDADMKADREKHSQVKNHATELRKQIAMNEENKHQVARDKFEEGKKIQDYMTKEQRDLERIKQEKLDYLDKINIPQKYRVDLKKFKVLN